ncbi:MAG: hypothetical protein HS111_17630 [Kofleriaceae bacterium]|nr:hypothetical protein [Kofleriaceae bacterium]
MGDDRRHAIVLDDKVIIGHVGDSRGYRLRDGELVQLTEDRSLINDCIKMKRMTAEEAENWPHKNVVVRALGMKAVGGGRHPHTEKPRVGDCYLLCSDGLTGMVTDDRIAVTLATERDLDRAVDTLIEDGQRRRRDRPRISTVLARVDAG